MKEFLWPRMAERSRAPELMDDFSSDTIALHKTLRVFSIVNIVLSRIRFLLKRHILADILKRKQKQVTILDVGAGGCDVALWIVKELRALNIEATLFCLDHDPRVISYARGKMKGHPAVTVLEGDARQIVSLNLKPHYIISNHFLHHCPDETIPDLVRLLFESASQGLLINDLLRNPWAYLGYTVFGRFFLSRGFAFHDGRLSIRKGFRPVELEGFVGRAGLAGHLHVKPVFPGHVCLWGTRP